MKKGQRQRAFRLPCFPDFTGPLGVASLARGSEIVFEYYLPKSLVDEEDRRRLVTLKALGAPRGEPSLSQFEPTILTARVKELSFTQVLGLRTR